MTLRDGTESRVKEPKDIRSTSRRDVVLIAFLVVIAAIAALADPGQVFEWIARREEVQFDESLVIVVLLGAGFAAFLWRRWIELSRRVAEYQRLQTELGRINREALALSETDDLLQSCLTSDEAYQVVMRHIESEIPGCSGAICSITNRRDLVEMVARWGDPTVSQTLFEPKDCWGLRRGRVNVLTDGARLVCAHIGAAPPAYALCVPMMAQGETLGILYLDSGKIGGKPSPAFRPPSESQERMVKTLAEHLALAVANLNLRETLRMQSIRDPLTGLFNRRYMEESLDRELRRAVRKKAALGVMMVDVDHFKRFNDAFGHEAGDAVLKELARIFGAQLRAEDIACRYGGEEFALILPEAPVEAVRERAEQLLRIVRESQVQYRGQTLEHISISIGLAGYPQNGSAAEVLLRAADAALYRAKEQGRDRVVVA